MKSDQQMNYRPFQTMQIQEFPRVHSPVPHQGSTLDPQGNLRSPHDPWQIFLFFLAKAVDNPIICVFIIYSIEIL